MQGLKLSLQSSRERVLYRRRAQGIVKTTDAKKNEVLLKNYKQGQYYCELLGHPSATIPKIPRLWDRLKAMDPNELVHRSGDITGRLLDLGITFTVYSDRDAIDRILPFDIIPRVLTAQEWQIIEGGVRQRVKALNLFLHDIYHDQKIIKDGVVPADVVLGNKNYLKEMQGYSPPLGTYIQIAGIDIVRGTDGIFYVLEDNARTPSGVSYVVENRHLVQRAFPDLLDGFTVRSVSDYGPRLHEKLREIAPVATTNPNVVLLTPGVYNSAYFEHVFLAQEMGIQLVEGRDLVVFDDCVMMNTVAGLQRVDVIYRRVDDQFLDPEFFNPESMLGVKGLMRCVLAGNVTLANAVGTGVADDKAVYAYVPDIIRYYLSEEAILHNVETHICRQPDALAYTLENLDKLVVKPVGGSGGYGIVIGPLATAEELDECRELLKKDPENFISQATVSLSVCPTLTEDGEVYPCHVDLRPFAITGEDTWVLPGGLTRVAMRPGSMIVNSSQGGGTKDTWVLEEDVT